MITKKDLIKLESLLYLLSITQHASKRKASDALSTSVDTVNKYLAELESELGFTLFTSNGRGSKVTPQAQEILPLAETLKSILREIEFIAGENSEVAGIVRVAVEDGISQTLFDDGISSLFNIYPNLKIISENVNERANIISMEADIGISYLPPAGGDLVLCYTHKVPCGLFAAENYIKKFGMPYNMEDMLNNHRFCTHTDYARRMFGWKDLIKEVRHVVYTGNSIFGVNKMTMHGGGIGVFPLQSAPQDLLKIYGLSEELNVNLYYNIYIVAHKNTKNIPRIRTMIDYFKELLRSGENS